MAKKKKISSKKHTSKKSSVKNPKSKNKKVSCDNKLSDVQTIVFQPEENVGFFTRAYRYFFPVR